MSASFRALSLSTCALIMSLLAACGGGGGGGGGSTGAGTSPPSTNPPVASPPTATAITLQSSAGDPIGLGQSYSYNPTNAIVTVNESLGRLAITVHGDQQWTADFLAPNSSTPLRVGTYPALSNFPVVNPAVGAFRWFGEGRGCVASEATVTINSVGYSGGGLAYIDLQFERYCDGASAPLRGRVQWTAADRTMPPGIVNPVPPGLWQPGPGAVPSAGNYVLLQSEDGDVVGLGRSHLYTSQTAFINAQGGVGPLGVSVVGEQQWYGEFHTVLSEPRLVQGYYADLRSARLHNPTRGGLAWTGDGRGCDGLSGWMAVDRAIYVNQSLVGITMRFEQRCSGSSAVLRGAIHWDAPVPASGPPATLTPAGSWQAPSGSIPSTGNFLYLSSEPGDFVGVGQINTHTPLDTVFTVTANAGLLSVNAFGSRRWFGYFQPPAGQAILQPGVYADLPRYLNTAPPSGAMSWSTFNGCLAIRGWTAIDSVAYTAGALTAIELRFEQICDNSTGSLKGQLRWTAADSRTPVGPTNPPPTVLWRPAPGAVPLSGNFLYVQSDRSDFIGQGLTAGYTQTNSQLTLSQQGAGVRLDVIGDESWSADIQPMNGLSQLVAGYYAGLARYPFHNPARGGFSFSGEARGCNTLQAGFVVDRVSYVGGQLTELDLRFEQHCDGSSVGAVRGAIHWVQGDTTAPPGPATPPPNLWRPADGATPSAGTFVYLESTSGDFLGQGRTTLDTAPPSNINILANGNRLSVNLAGARQAAAEFIGMSSVAQLQPGYYRDLQAFGRHNPAKGGLGWTIDGLGCNDVSGWFVVDSVSYVGNAMRAIDLRFEMVCESSIAPLRGRVRWEQP